MQNNVLTYVICSSNQPQYFEKNESLYLESFIVSQQAIIHTSIINFQQYIYVRIIKVIKFDFTITHCIEITVLYLIYIYSDTVIIHKPVFIPVPVL